MKTLILSGDASLLLSKEMKTTVGKLRKTIEPQKKDGGSRVYLHALPGYYDAKDIEIISNYIIKNSNSADVASQNFKKLMKSYSAKKPGTQSIDYKLPVQLGDLEAFDNHAELFAEFAIPAFIEHAESLNDGQYTHAIFLTPNISPDHQISGASQIMIASDLKRDIKEGNTMLEHSELGDFSWQLQHHNMKKASANGVPMIEPSDSHKLIAEFTNFTQMSDKNQNFTQKTHKNVRFAPRDAELVF